MRWDNPISEAEMSFIYRIVDQRLKDAFANGMKEFMAGWIANQVERILRGESGEAFRAAIQKKALTTVQALAKAEGFYLQDVEKLICKREALTREIKALLRGYDAALRYSKKFAIGEVPTPPAPMTILPRRPEDDEIPDRSGIYFGWDGNVVCYVGRSVNLKQRLREGHHALKVGESISWLEFPKSRIGQIESFYIGLCAPARNGGIYIAGHAEDVVDQLDHAELIQHSGDPVVFGDGPSALDGDAQASDSPDTKGG